MSSKTRSSFAKLNTQVRAACGPIPRKNDLPAASSSDGNSTAGNTTAGNIAAGEVSKRMADLYRQFLVDPSADRYQAALTAFQIPVEAATPSLLTIDNALREGRYETVRTLTRQWSRFFALSPHFHRLAAIAARELGEMDDAELERFTSQACLQGILNSGDGSTKKPYLIANRADAQEVLTKLKLNPSRQYCRENEGALCDVFEVHPSVNNKPTATREFWFSLAQGVVENSAPAAKKAAKSRPRRAKTVTA